MKALAHWVALLTWLPFVPYASAADRHVAVNGSPAGQGTLGSPWDIASALGGRHTVQAGDTLWLQRGTYKRLFENTGMGWPVRLVGRADAPLHVRAVPGERVTIDGGLNVQPPSTHLWIWDLEILVSEPRPEKPVPPDSTYLNVNRPWGGLNVYSGEGCKFINLVIHDNSQGVSWWAGSSNSELHGCILYDNGWAGTDRGHGHAIYTQNRDGLKTVSDCIFTGGFGYTLHAYGSSRAFVDNYLVEGNMAYDAHAFLIGGGRPSHGIRVFTNFFFGVPVQLGYSAPTNADCAVRGNVIVNAGLSINRFGQVTQENNLVVGRNDPRPTGIGVVLRPNKYEANRAHLAIFNWERKPVVSADVSSFLKPGDKFVVLNPRDFFGAPVLSGIADGQLLRIPVSGDFAAFVLLRR